MRISLKQSLLASTIVAGVIASAAPASAQNAGVSTTTVPAAPTGVGPATSATPGSSADGSDQQNAIIVTGSRIPHPELTSASPITVVSGTELKQTGTTRVEDLLNSLPQVFAGQGSSVTNGASGTATVDLRDLGPQRTLVLVNGRRLIPGDPTVPFADINFIPGSLIKRVDILTGGASSTYGADAVAGVVNFVMDTEFTGFRVDGQYSFNQHDNDAGSNSEITKALKAAGFNQPTGNTLDGGQIDTTATFGAGTDDGRGHVTAYFGYRQIHAITEDQRDYSACVLSANSAAKQAATGRVYSCGGSGTAFPANFYSAGTYYNAAGVKNQNLYNYAPTEYYQRNDERYTAGTFAHYDVSDAFKPYMEFMFMDDTTQAALAPSGDFFNTTTINCNNPLASDGLKTSIGCASTSDAATNTQLANAYIGRRNVEGGPRQYNEQHTDYRGVIGAKGDIAKGISYDAYYQYSRVIQSETEGNQISVSRLQNATDVVTSPTTGQPVCASTLPNAAGIITDANCVPYNIFQAGGVTSAALNYLEVPTLEQGRTTEQVADASLTFLGSEYGIVSPFAHDGISLNVGAEYRKETLSVQYDETQLNNDLAGSGGASHDTAGAFDVKEGFAEASIPLVQDKPFFHNLELDTGYRRSHYKIDDTSSSFDTNTYKFQAVWAVTRDISFRGGYNRAVRAPNILELFTPQGVVLDGATDPCAGAAVNGLVNGNTAAMCANSGVTAAQFGNIGASPAQQYNGLEGGNTKLTPEVSDSYTAGIVLTPSFLHGFQATVDWFDIKIKNVIGTLGADYILKECIQTGSPSFCNLVHRNASGSLFRTADGYIVDIDTNTGKQSTNGIDVAVSYSQAIGTYGKVGFNVAGTYLLGLKDAPAGAVEYNCAGYYGATCGIPAPKWRSRSKLSYTAPDGIGVSLLWRYFSKVKDDTLSSNPTLAGATLAGNARIKAQSYFDLDFTIPIGDVFTWHIGANNIADKAPPINGLGLSTENGNTFSQVYDQLGRYIYSGVTLDF